MTVAAIALKSYAKTLVCMCPKRVAAPAATIAVGSLGMINVCVIALLSHAEFLK